jgi:hypothetical protein
MPQTIIYSEFQICFNECTNVNNFALLIVRQRGERERERERRERRERERERERGEREVRFATRNMCKKCRIKAIMDFAFHHLVDLWFSFYFQFKHFLSLNF